MTRYDDETLMRRLDGELSPEASDRIDSEVRQNPELARRVSQMRGLRSLAGEAFAVSPDPRDAALSRLIAAQVAAPSSWSRMSQALAHAFAPRRAVLWGGLAVATFVGGVLVGPLFDPRGEGFSLLPGGAISDAGLVRVLDERLASDGPDARRRAVALTYRDASGRWCRTFSAGDAGVAGLACRNDGRWSIRALAPLGAPSGEVRTAAVDTPAAILAAVDANLATETIDATAEAQARDGGWR